MKKRTTRRALVMSLLSLLLCCSMLVGTTFAWFTDSVTSGKNKIIAGNLDVELYHTSASVKTAETVANKTNLFVDENGKQILWEPGAVVWENLTVANEGSLALKYQLSVNFADQNAVEGTGAKLSEALKVAVVDPIAATATREQVLTAAGAGMPLVSFTESGKLFPVDIDIPNAPADAVVGSKTYGVVIWWEPSAEDNKWNIQNGAKTTDGEPLQIDLGINLVATQLEAEDDSFGTDYDKEATYPAVASDTVDGTTAATITVGEVAVTVPEGVAAGNYTVSVDSKNQTVAANGAVSLNYEINLLKDGIKVQEQTGISYPVAIQLECALDIDRVLHNDEEITVYEYNPLTGILTFETNSFSPFSVEYVRMGSDIVVENGKVTGGTIAGEYKPADVDPSLDDADSEYIAINYTIDGETRYVISERANTVILAAADTVYTPVYDNYEVKTASGRLYAEISALQNKEHATVYLLPGTYNEATTIGVYSSMDIIGLGDKDSVKVIKTSSSSSNRHLFNCSGTKADYIQVTLSNLYLDATATTTNSKDNAAVQSIRKSKVKCYDLTVVKGTGWDAVAFYVNGNNAVDGVKYPAYMYVENCALNTTKSFGVVSTNGTYKFFHSGLTYNGTAYTSNSGSINNKTMEANDWEWD